MENKDKKDSKSSVAGKLDSVNESQHVKKPNDQTNEEIAEQGFTVRDGHNHPYEKPISNDRDVEEDANFRIPDDYDLMEGDEHEENQRDKDAEK
ncbi:hypothetical protein AAGV33_05150 [Flavobacterium sp. FBOR7N2.3]|uniref:Uncharacterized protein n=1 Tax=Flavobacterium magnesitis TaxID=3138077 RepID=A0ABV4TI54_9FLAO